MHLSESRSYVRAGAGGIKIPKQDGRVGIRRLRDDEQGAESRALGERNAKRGEPGSASWPKG
jgi:hypothetical protein